MQLAEELRSTVWQITFHYINGDRESFNIYNLIQADTTNQDIRQEIRRFIKEDWWTVTTQDETIFINSANVLKIEVKPPLPSVETEGILTDAERVTALTRGGRQEFGVRE